MNRSSINKGVQDSVFIGMLELSIKGSEVHSYLTESEMSVKVSVPSAPLVNSAMTSRQSVDDEMARGRTDHLPSYAKAKEMKLLTFHTQGCI